MAGDRANRRGSLVGAATARPPRLPPAWPRTRTGNRVDLPVTVPAADGHPRAVELSHTR